MMTKKPKKAMKKAKKGKMMSGMKAEMPGMPMNITKAASDKITTTTKSRM